MLYRVYYNLIQKGRILQEMEPVTSQEKTKDPERISVRSLVEFILRSGDIDNRTGGAADREAMQLGSRIHRQIQAGMGPEYQAEVPLSMDFPCDDFLIRVEGRADGIVAQTENEPALIDEIKGIRRSPELLEEPAPLHLAQAKCYAFIYAAQQQLEKIRVRVSYVSLEMEGRSAAEVRKNIRYFTFPYTRGELESWFHAVLEEYRKWARFAREWKKIRTLSIKQTDFPFSYREGQKKLTRDVYLTILRGRQLFIQAPTGTGKTLSCVFPAVKAMGEGLAEHIFYLTARTITRTAASAAFDQLREKGLRLKSIVLTAKEKICPMDETLCDPDHCPYAKGHFDRVNDAVYDQITRRDRFDREDILSAAKEYMVCPFEFSLDIASWMDAVIGDYNYAFHPRAKLKRFFGEGVKGEYLFLVDEAHNLVDRGREMYSASIVKEDILALNRLVKGKFPKLSRALSRVNTALLAYKKELETTGEAYRVLDGPGAFPVQILGLYGAMDETLKEMRDHPGAWSEELSGAVLDLYFEAGSFLDTVDVLDENYVVYTERTSGGEFVFRLLCANPAANLKNCFDRGRSSILFSATMLPIDYFKEMLGTKESYAVYADSCFDAGRLRVLTAADVSTRYTRRDEKSFSRIAEYILRMVSARSGNYMVFFSSYKMLEDTASYFDLICPKDVKIIRQSSRMSEEEREAFLAAFDEPEQGALRRGGMIGFCVMGSFFGEGIDLRGERLIGVMVVGPGLPMVCSEQEILKGWFDRRGEDGFRLAYQCPGMNKVLQAAGRVIRTEEDRGVVILVDERFAQARYRQMFPREWAGASLCRITELDGMLRRFWEPEES